MFTRLGKYKRIIIGLGLALMTLISGLVIMGENIEFTGILFCIVSFGMIVYLLFWGMLTRNISLQIFQSWKNKEPWIASMLFSLLCLIGIIESSPEYLIMAVLFTIALIGILIFSFFSFEKNRLKIPIFLFFIGVGFALIKYDDSFGDEEIYAIVTGTYFITLFLISIQWIFKQVKSIINLKNEKAKTELMHLQSQVNPHFFFNMLNNLYGLVKTDSAKAQELILKLSDMMRYSIYEGQKDFVTIEEEVAYLQNYIELHKMRYRKKIEVNFNCHIEQEQQKVLPLLFIILLENAFKHGVENLRTDAYVNIALSNIGDDILFEVENNFDPSSPESKSGIGLKNLKRRLELVYPNKHSFNFSINEDKYKAQLKLIA